MTDFLDRLLVRYQGDRVTPFAPSANRYASENSDLGATEPRQVDKDRLTEVGRTVAITDSLERQPPWEAEAGPGIESTSVPVAYPVAAGSQGVSAGESRAAPHQHRPDGADLPATPTVVSIVERADADAPPTTQEAHTKRGFQQQHKGLTQVEPGRPTAGSTKPFPPASEQALPRVDAAHAVEPSGHGIVPSNTFPRRDVTTGTPRRFPQTPSLDEMGNPAPDLIGVPVGRVTGPISRLDRLTSPDVDVAGAQTDTGSSDPNSAFDSPNSGVEHPDRASSARQLASGSKPFGMEEHDHRGHLLMPALQLRQEELEHTRGAEGEFGSASAAYTARSDLPVAVRQPIRRDRQDSEADAGSHGEDGVAVRAASIPESRAGMSVQPGPDGPSQANLMTQRDRAAGPVYRATAPPPPAHLQSRVSRGRPDRVPSIPTMTAAAEPLATPTGENTHWGRQDSEHHTASPGDDDAVRSLTPAAGRQAVASSDPRHGGPMQPGFVARRDRVTSPGHGKAQRSPQAPAPSSGSTSVPVRLSAAPTMPASPVTPVRLTGDQAESHAQTGVASLGEEMVDDAAAAPAAPRGLRSPSHLRPAPAHLPREAAAPVRNAHSGRSEAQPLGAAASPPAIVPATAARPHHRAAAPTAPVPVSVVIGSVEFRAAPPPPPANTSRTVAVAAPRLSLDEYLRNRRSGRP